MGRLVKSLRQGRSTRLLHVRGIERCGRIPAMLSLHVRPPKIEDRVRLVNLPSDLIKGTGNETSVGVMVECSSRLLLLVSMDHPIAVLGEPGFAAKQKLIAAPFQLRLAEDQGKKMAMLPSEPSAKTGVKVYTSDPHNPLNRADVRTIQRLQLQYLQWGGSFRYGPSEILTPFRISSTNDCCSQVISLSTRGPLPNARERF